MNDFYVVLLSRNSHCSKLFRKVVIVTHFMMNIVTFFMVVVTVSVLNHSQSSKFIIKVIQSMTLALILQNCFQILPIMIILSFYFPDSESRIIIIQYAYPFKKNKTKSNRVWSEGDLDAISSISSDCIMAISHWYVYGNIIIV